MTHMLQWRTPLQQSVSQTCSHRHENSWPSCWAVQIWPFLLLAFVRCSSSHLLVGGPKTSEPLTPRFSDSWVLVLRLLAH
eukprot:4849612-Amphidinium_carterae.2